MMPGLLIVSVYRPDLYHDAVRSIGLARDVEVIIDRRVGDRRHEARAMNGDARNDRRQMHINEQLRSEGWVLVSAEERAAAAAQVCIGAR